MATASEGGSYPPIRQDLPYNFVILLGHLLLFTGFTAMMDVMNVLAPLTRDMNYPSWITGIFVTLSNAAPGVPMIFSAYYLERRSRELPLFKTYSLLFLLGILAICLSSFLIRADHSLDRLAIWALITAVLFTYFSNGLFNTPLFDILGKAISSEKRGLMFGVQGAISAVLVMVLGSRVLNYFNTHYARHIAPRLTFSTAFCFAIVSVLLLWAVREPSEQKPQREVRVSFWRYLLDAFSHFKKDWVFTKSILARVFSYTPLMFLGFITNYGIESIGLSRERLPGYMMMCGAFANFFGNLIFGWLASRFGYVFILRIGFLGMIAALGYWISFPAVASFVQAKFPFVLNLATDYRLYLYSVGNVIYQPSFVTMMLWGRNYPIDIAPPEFRSTYISLSRVLMLPFSALVPFLGGLLVDSGNKVSMGHGYRLNFSVAIVSLFVGFLFTFFLPNIRRRESVQ